jgi:hypothetical protein
MDVGEGEDHFIKCTKDAADVLIEKGYRSGEDLMYYQVPMAIHSEKDWGKRIHLPLLYFFGEIGEPVSCRLTGGDTAGITGPELRINPIITYDSGFTISQIGGSYSVEHPEVLAISKDGTISAKSEGTAYVSFHCGKIETVRQYKVVKE